jgi:hypothetical protein
MSRFLCACASALVLAIGCGRQDSAKTTKPTNAPGENPLTAPVDYLGAAAKAKTASERTIDTVSINQAIQLFNASEGRYPKDLNELVTEKYLPQIPPPPHGMKIVYDAARGQVKIVPQ